MIAMPVEERGQPARTRVGSLFRRLFHHRPRQEQQQEQMEEFRAEEWLAGDYLDHQVAHLNKGNHLMGYRERRLLMMICWQSQL